MYQDPRYLQNLQGENAFLKGQLNRITNMAKAVEDKYQRSLREMSAVMQANKILKMESDQAKMTMSDTTGKQISKLNEEHRQQCEKLIAERDQLTLQIQRLQRSNDQLNERIASLESQNWEAEKLKQQIQILRKENEQLLLDQHPLIKKASDNPEAIEKQKKIEKLQKLIEQLNEEIESQKIHAKKAMTTFQLQKQSLKSEIGDLQNTISQLNKEKTYQKELEGIKYMEENKNQQKQILDLRARNAELVNQIEKINLKMYESGTLLKKQENKTVDHNEVQQHLLQTLKSLHAQLQPMRYEIQELRRQKYLDRQNASKHKANLQMKILTANNEVEGLKKYAKELEDRNQNLLSEKREFNWDKGRMYELEEEKRILEGRVIVYQAMQMVARNREEPHHIERINEFQQRIRLLLEEQSHECSFSNPQTQSPQNLHQLIAMKAYILQLDTKLQAILSEHDHLHKKYQHYKQKYTSLAQQNKAIVQRHRKSIEGYRGKIKAYEKLVNKLTLELEKYLNDFSGSELRIEETYKSQIILYETKITNLYEEINSLKANYKNTMGIVEHERDNLYDRIRGMEALNSEITVLRAQNSSLQNIINRLQYELQELKQLHTTKVSSSSEDDLKKVISEKNRKILQLEEQLQILSNKLNNIDFNHQREIETYNARVSRLQSEKQRLETEIRNVSRVPQRSGHEIEALLAKIDKMEKSIESASINHTQIIERTPDYSQQVSRLREENNYLKIEMEKIREELKIKMVSKNNQIEELKNIHRDEIYNLREEYQLKVRELREKVMSIEYEISLKNKQLDYKNKELQRFAHDTQHKMEDGSKINHLEHSNTLLRAQLEQMKVNYAGATQQSEQLVLKVKDMENYISSLKGNFDSVSKKFQEMEREIVQKENMIKDKEAEYKRLNDRYQRQMASINQQIDLTKDEQEKRNLKKQQELRVIEEELNTVRLQIENTWRNIGYKQQEMEDKWREYDDRMREIEKREKDAEDREDYLVKYQREIQFNEEIRIRLQKQNTSLKAEVKRIHEELLQNLDKNPVQVKPESPTQIAELKQQILQLNRKVIELQQQHEHNLNTLKNKNYVQIKEYEHTIELLQMDLKSRDNRIEWLMKDLESQKIQIEDWRKDCNQKDNKILQIKRELQEAKEKDFQINQLLQKIKILQEKEAGYKNEINRLLNQIEKMNDIILNLQQKEAQNLREKEQRSSFPDSIYQSELLQKNSKLEFDLEELRQKFLTNSDNQRTYDEMLAILVINFAQIEALRERVTELQQNFNKEHQNSINALLELQKLRDIDDHVNFDLIKEIEEAHKVIHEDENISRSKYLKKREVFKSVIANEQKTKMTATQDESKFKNEETGGKVGIKQRTSFGSGVDNEVYETKYIQNRGRQNSWNFNNYLGPNSGAIDQRFESPHKILQSVGSPTIPNYSQMMPGMIESRTQVMPRSEQYSEMSQPSSSVMQSQTSLRNQVIFSSQSPLFGMRAMTPNPMGAQFMGSQNSYVGPYIMSNNRLYQ